MKMRDVALAASWQDIVSSVRCRCELFHKLVVSYSYCDALIITAQAHKASNKWHENHLCGLFRQHDLPTLKSAVCVCECVCLMVSCCNCFSLLLLSWNDFALSLTPPSPVSLSLSLSVTVAGLCETYRCSIDFFQHANTGTAAVALVEFRPGDRRRRKLCHLHGKLRNSDQVSRLWASDGQRETDYASVVVPGNVLRCFPRAELQCLSLLILWSVCDGVITECVCVCVWSTLRAQMCLSADVEAIQSFFTGVHFSWSTSMLPILIYRMVFDFFQLLASAVKFFYLSIRVMSRTFILTSLRSAVRFSVFISLLSLFNRSVW